MKFVTIFDEDSKEVIAQFGEDEHGGISGICTEGVSIIIDGELLSSDTEDDSPITSSFAMACSCGAKASELDIVKTITSYMDEGNLADIEIEYKVVCPKCGKEGDLSRNKEGAVLSWNECIIKEKIQ